MTDPQILAADEPTGDLDAKSADEILDLMQPQPSIQQTIVMVTHDPRAASRAHSQNYGRRACCQGLQP